MFFVVLLISFLMSAFKLLFLRMLSNVFREVCFLCGQVRRPPTRGTASSMVMSGVASLSIVTLAIVSAVSL